MKRSHWSLLLILILLLVSALLYTEQINLFHRPGETFFYLLQDLAFLPIQVLLVTLILNEMLQRRAKQQMQNKLNMVIGAFYSEMGADLLQRCAAFDNRLDTLRAHVLIGAGWTNQDFATAQQQVRAHGFSIDVRRPELATFKQFLLDRRSCLLALLENPNLLEHETFTDLLWAVSHLTEELAFRARLEDLPESDYAHLSGDLQRAYTLLIYEWLAYVKHLRDNYPYMYSLVVRMNPFVPDASPVVC